MLYRRLAEFVMICHFLVAMFCLIGAAFAWKQPWLALLHIPLVLWVCAASTMGWDCPLTPLENHLRRAAGDQGYAGGFIDHYLRFGSNKERKDGVWIAVWVGGVNAAAYGVVFLNRQ